MRPQHHSPKRPPKPPSRCHEQALQTRRLTDERPPKDSAWERKKAKSSCLKEPAYVLELALDTAFFFIAMNWLRPTLMQFGCLSTMSAGASSFSKSCEVLRACNPVNGKQKTARAMGLIRGRGKRFLCHQDLSIRCRNRLFRRFPTPEISGTFTQSTRVTPNFLLA